MSYTKTTWQDGDIITTERLNKIESGIEQANSGSIPSASSATPQALGTAAAGSSSDYSRADHVHAMPTAANVGAIALPSNPSTNDFLVFNGSAWVAQSLSTWSGGNY